MLRLRIESLIIFSLSHARDKTKNIFLFFFTELKTYHLSYFSICKHYTIDIADPSSTQDACYMNFVIELARRGVRKTLLTTALMRDMALFAWISLTRYLELQIQCVIILFCVLHMYRFAKSFS